MPASYDYPEFLKAKIGKLTPQQISVIIALTDLDDSRSQNEIAEEHNIHSSTISMWKTRNTHGFSDALVAFGLYFASQTITPALKQWKKLIDEGHWKAIEKAIDYAVDYTRPEMTDDTDSDSGIDDALAGLARAREERENE